MLQLFRKIDLKIFWVIRYITYKLFAGRLKGIGYLGSPSFVKGFRRFYAGAGLGIFPGWRVEIIDGRVEIGSNVRIGNNLLLNCGSKVTIGDSVTISANVFIGTTDYEISDNLNLPFEKWISVERPVVVGKGCFIGFGAVLLPGTKLGKGCVVGANSVVKHEFEAGSIIAGSPARVVRVRK